MWKAFTAATALVCLAMALACAAAGLLAARRGEAAIAWALLACAALSVLLSLAFAYAAKR